MAQKAIPVVIEGFQKWSGMFTGFTKGLSILGNAAEAMQKSQMAEAMILGREAFEKKNQEVGTLQRELAKMRGTSMGNVRNIVEQAYRTRDEMSKNEYGFQLNNRYSDEDTLKSAILLMRGGLNDIKSLPNLIPVMTKMEATLENFDGEQMVTYMRELATTQGVQSSKQLALIAQRIGDQQLYWQKEMQPYAKEMTESLYKELEYSASITADTNQQFKLAKKNAQLEEFKKLSKMDPDKLFDAVKSGDFETVGKYSAYSGLSMDRIVSAAYNNDKDILAKALLESSKTIRNLYGNSGYGMMAAGQAGFQDEFQLGRKLQTSPEFEKKLNTSIAEANAESNANGLLNKASDERSVPFFTRVGNWFTSLTPVRWLEQALASTFDATVSEMAQANIILRAIGSSVDIIKNYLIMRFFAKGINGGIKSVTGKGAGGWVKSGAKATWSGTKNTYNIARTEGVGKAYTHVADSFKSSRPIKAVTEFAKSNETLSKGLSKSTKFVNLVTKQLSKGASVLGSSIKTTTGIFGRIGAQVVTMGSKLGSAVKSLVKGATTTAQAGSTMAQTASSALGKGAEQASKSSSVTNSISKWFSGLGAKAKDAGKAFSNFKDSPLKFMGGSAGKLMQSIAPKLGYLSALGFGAYDYATAKNGADRRDAIVGTAGTLAGTAAGAKAGAWLGGAIGTSLLPGLGTAAGAAIGGVAGAVGGSFLGSDLAKTLAEAKGEWLEKNLGLEGWGQKHIDVDEVDELDNARPRQFRAGLWEAKENQSAIVHKGEAILPKRIADMFREKVGKQGSFSRKLWGQAFDTAINPVGSTLKALYSTVSSSVKSGKGILGTSLNWLKNFINDKNAPNHEGQQKSYVERFLPAYLPAAKQYGIPLSLMLAQGALESGWGTAQSGANNYWGIKALPGQSGTTRTTMEDSGTGMYQTSASFANYESLIEGAKAYASLLAKYTGVAGASNVAQAVYALQHQPDGMNYASDSEYADKLMSTITANGFSYYDNPEVISKLAKSLGLQGYRKGSPYITRDQLALVHKGETITPPNQLDPATKQIAEHHTELIQTLTWGFEYIVKELRSRTSQSNDDRPPIAMPTQDPLWSR